MAYIVMAYIGMAYTRVPLQSIVMAYIVMAYIVMAYTRVPLQSKYRADTDQPYRTVGEENFVAHYAAS